MDNTLMVYIGGLLSSPLSSLLGDYIYIHVSHNIIEKRKDMEYIAKQKREDKYVNEHINDFEDSINMDIKNMINNQESLIKEVNKLSNQINTINLIDPRPEIINPLLDAVDVYGNEKSLNKMFAAILVKSMDKNNFGVIRPYFVEMIKELSPIDALILQRLDINGGPIVTVTEEVNIKGTIMPAYRVLAPNYLGIDIRGAKEIDITSSLDNLLRMNIINISYENPLANYNYDEFFDKPLLRELQEDKTGKHIDIKKGGYNFTSLGAMFISAIINDD